MTWEHSQPMPMRGSPCVVTESNALSYLEKLPNNPRMFLFSDSDRALPDGWGYVASVRPGTPPEGIMAEIDAWLKQYPNAWLAVDLRVGVIPPSVPNLENMLRTFPRVVIILVSDDSANHQWPKWEFPL
ncbi:MAG: hypothetical protein VW862_03405 [Euryarchaeota archaeon]